MENRSKSPLIWGVFAVLISGEPAFAYEVIEVVDGGRVTGQVTLIGKPLPAKKFKVEKTPEVCGHEDRVLQEVRVKGGMLADVVLELVGIKEGKPYLSEISIGGPPPGRRNEMAGSSKEFPGTSIRPEKCIFGAFTGVVANGKLMRFKNADPVKHSPHTYGVKGRVRKSMFNQDLAGNGTLEQLVKFKSNKQRAMKLECDQHDHMQNWFRRVESPYYAFSADDGSFVIDRIPPGKYQLVAWHPKFKKILEKTVTVSANKSADVSFEFVSKVK